MNGFFFSLANPFLEPVPKLEIGKMLLCKYVLYRSDGGIKLDLFLEHSHQLFLTFILLDVYWIYIDQSFLMYWYFLALLPHKHELDVTILQTKKVP